VVNQVYEPVDHFRPLSTVDWRHRARPELGGALTARCYGHQSSLWRRGEGEGDGAELTEAKIGRRGGVVASAAERNGTRRQCLVLGGSGHE
jgi:hypothetical protein